MWMADTLIQWCYYCNSMLRGGSEMSLYSLDNLIMSAASSNVDMNTYDAKWDHRHLSYHIYCGTSVKLLKSVLKKM